MPPDDAHPPVRQHFASRLRSLRIARGYATARKFAQALGIDENRYTRYERAEVEPDLTLLSRICIALRVSASDLLESAVAVDGYSGFAEPQQAALMSPPTPAAPAPTPVSPRRALAWQLAAEMARLRSDGLPPSIERVALVGRMAAEIEADPFVYVTRIAADPLVSQLPPDTASHLARLAELLMALVSKEALASGSDAASVKKPDGLG